jgi:hypothetical protein
MCSIIDIPALIYADDVQSLYLNAPYRNSLKIVFL